MKLKLIGDKELASALRGLPGEVNKNFQKVAVKAAQPTVDRMHRLAPVGLTGDLADSIGIVKEKQGVITIGPRRKGGYKGFAGHLVEFGTKKRKTKSGANRGIMPKKPFVRPAWEQTDTTVLANIKKETNEIVNRFWNKTVKK